MRSPCTDYCVIHRKLRLCEGCGRSVDEIANWLSMSVEDRRTVMAALPRRLKRMQDADRESG